MSRAVSPGALWRRYGYAGRARGTGGTGERREQRPDPGADAVRPHVPGTAGHRRGDRRRDRPRQRPRHPPAPRRRRPVAATAAGRLRPRAGRVHRLLRPRAARTRPAPGPGPRRADRDGLHPPADPPAARHDRPRRRLPPAAHPRRGTRRRTLRARAPALPAPVPSPGIRHSMLPLRHPNVDAVQCLAGQSSSPGANVTGVIRPGRGN
ncbi:hypothetical protein SBRY_50785 [Actinacidiphila bryophytorum]|uniref:Uncharacterized protein n=1 Tax=Actinacidiphila bryophytorum TaxID=1436133 RepID=A0A9W4MFI1_9ACTN|nr:hypothetical protein SBRY_50785 [Actinacidiphila bryophytorum]